MAWRANDAKHFVELFRVNGLKEVGNERLCSSQVGFVVLGDACCHGPVEVARKLVLESILAEQHIAPEEISCDGVLWTTDDGFNRVQFTSARSNG